MKKLLFTILVSIVVIQCSPTALCEKVCPICDDNNWISTVYEDGMVSYVHHRDSTGKEINIVHQRYMCSEGHWFQECVKGCKYEQDEH